MASLALRSKFVACVSGDSVLVYHLGSRERQSYKIKKEEIEDACGKSEKEKSEEDVGKDTILASGFSPTGRLFAACDDHKQLTIWETGETWKTLSVRTLVRRCTSLAFHRSENSLLVGDKSGDVYSYSISEPEEAGVLLLGHVSMLLDVTFCGTRDEYVATADRDEKVRVSCMPNAHNIQTFCLGHTQFVSRLLYLPDEDLLLSGSGDGTIRLWDYTVGKEVSRANCKDVLQPESEEGEGGEGEGRQIAEGQSEGQKESVEKGPDADVHKTDVKCFSFDKTRRVLAVGFDRSSTILLYQLSSSAHSHSLTLAQTLDLGATLWDLTFDPEGRLWVLQAKEEQALALYVLPSNKTKLLEPISLTPADALSNTLETVNSDWEQFKDCVNAESPYSWLHKPKMNSAHRYFERKEQRLAQGSKRKEEAPPSPSAGASDNQTGSKKAKTE